MNGFYGIKIYHSFLNLSFNMNKGGLKLAIIILFTILTIVLISTYYLRGRIRDGGGANSSYTSNAGVISMTSPLDGIFINVTDNYESSEYNNNSQPYTTINDIKNEIIKQAKIYGVDVNIALRIARCESKFNSTARNPRSSAVGVYQFLVGTWEWIGATGDRGDYKENIQQFMLWYSRGYEHWWECK